MLLSPEKSRQDYIEDLRSVKYVLVLSISMQILLLEELQIDKDCSI